MRRRERVIEIDPSDVQHFVDTGDTEGGEERPDDFAEAPQLRVGHLVQHGSHEIEVGQTDAPLILIILLLAQSHPEGKYEIDCHPIHFPRRYFRLSTDDAILLHALGGGRADLSPSCHRR